MIFSINNVAESWLVYFSYAVFQNTIFLGIIFLLLYLLRNTNARFKYAIAILGIIKLLVPPFLPGSFGMTQITSPAIIELEMSMTTNMIPIEPAAPQLSFVSFLFLVWCATIFLYLMSSLLLTVRLKWRLRSSSFIKSLFVDDVFIDLYQSKKITVPMSIGIRPSRIYVPGTWSDLSLAQQDSLMRHEVAHIQRWDGFYYILQVIAQAVYFFHPLVWLLNSRINDYREMVCDDIAVERSHMSPLLYSRCLVHIAENMLPLWSTFSASALIKQRNKLYHRVNYQVKERTMKNLSNRKMWFMWSVLFMLFVPLSWYCKSEQAGNASQSSKAKLSGFIREHETNKPLEGVVLSIDGFGQSVTDENGFYAFDRIPSDNFVLKADYQGRSYDSPISFDEMPASASQLEKFGMTVNMHLNLKEPDKVPEIVVEAVRPHDEEVASENKLSQKLRERMNFVHASRSAIDSVYKINQAASTESQHLEREFDMFEKAPKPIGGMEAINQYLRYPQIAKKAGIEGRVVVNTFIDANGNVGDTKIIKSLGNSGCDEAAVAAIKQVKWIPAEKDGEPIATWIVVPIGFFLSEATPVAEPLTQKAQFEPSEKSFEKVKKMNELISQGKCKGKLIIGVYIDETGRVVDSRIEESCGNDECAQAALEQTISHNWQPALKDGKPISSWQSVSMVFEPQE
jgi:TonB family protein